MIFDHRQADLPDADRAMCDYAVKLSLTPGAMDESDVQRLRDHDFSDAAITIATQVISFFNYINRIADGLGVDDEPWMAELPREEWFRRKGRDYLSP